MPAVHAFDHAVLGCCKILQATLVGLFIHVSIMTPPN
jgi:hypothetical protein